MKLSDKQQIFSRAIARFILILHDHGIGCTLGEALRPDALTKLYAEQGKGIDNSLHELKLAIDLNLFERGVYLTDSTCDTYKLAGRLWKEMLIPEGCTPCWGGDFKDKHGKPKPDGNHFSFEHNGVK